MSTPIAIEQGRTRHLGRSIIAIAAALLANAGLSVGTDQVFHTLDVYPPWGQPMHDPSLNLVALSYRIVFGVVAGYVAARLAPNAPMRHVAVLGGIGLVLATLGGVVTITQYDLGPDWYPVALALLAFPTVWLGGVLHNRLSDRR